MYLFTQRTIDEIKDNPFDDEGRKIKEKQESLSRTLENVVNVPLNSKSFEFENVNIVDTNSKNQEVKELLDEDKNEDSYAIDLEEENRIFEELVNNLRESYDEVNQSVDSVEPQKEETTVIQQPITVYNTYDYESFNADDTYSEISEAQNNMSSIRERAEKAKKEAEESERILEKLSLEYEEKQKQLKETEKRNLIVNQQLADTLMTKKSFLDQKKKQYENEINSSNQRTANNNSKIIEFRDLIHSAEARKKEIDNKITRNEELLNTLSNSLSYEDILNSYNDSDEMNRRIG